MTDLMDQNFNYAHYFKQLVNVCDDDIASIALRFFPKDDQNVRDVVSQTLISAITSPWSFCSRIRAGSNIHQTLWHICQSYLKHFGVDDSSKELGKEIELLEFHLILIFAHKSGLLSEESVSELCFLWRSCSASSNETAPVKTASNHLAAQLSALLLKDPILGTSILSEFASFATANAKLRETPVIKQCCALFLKAVQTAVDDLPYIDTLSPQAQNERIFAVFYLISKLHIFSSIIPLSQAATTELVDSLINATSVVRPFTALVKDSKLQFVALCEDLTAASSSEFANIADSLCESISRALLAKTWVDFEDSANPSFSRVLRLFSSIIRKKALSDDDKVFWLFMASYTEKKTYIELFLSCCKECLGNSDLSLLKELLEMKPFSYSRPIWFILLIPHCLNLSQTLLLRTLCFSDQNQGSLNLGPGSNSAIATKVRNILIFLQKVDLLIQRAESLDEMSQEKLQQQLENLFQTSIFFSSDLALIEYFLDIGDLHPDTVISLIAELSNVKYPSVKSVRFKVPAGSDAQQANQYSEPLTNNHILAQVFSYYSYCALKNMTDAVYGCSVHLAPLFKDGYKNSTVKKVEPPDAAETQLVADSYMLAFSEDITEKYRANCTTLLDYGRAYCRLIYPLGLRLEVIENAFSLLFITYDHVHERIQDVAAEEFEGEGDMDKDDRLFAARMAAVKGASSLASSSVFTQSTSLAQPSAETNRRRSYQEQILGCLANEFLFRDMLFTLNECAKDLVNDIHRLDTEGVSFRLPTGQMVSLKMSDDVALSDHINRDSLQLPGFKDRLYRLQRAISEALWRLSIVSGVVPVYGSLELVLSQHDYYKREFKAALANEWDRNRNTSTTSHSIVKRTASESTLRGASISTNRPSAQLSQEMRLLRSGFVEKLASSTYMLALSWSANRRDLERCEQILGSFPDKFDGGSEFGADVRFQRGLNAFIADVLLMGPVSGNGGKRLRLAIPFESPSKSQKVTLTRSSSNQSIISTSSTPTTPNQTENRMSTLNQLVATSLTQFEIKEKLGKLFDSDTFAHYVSFFQSIISERYSDSPFGRPAIMEDALSRESLAAITTIDLAFCYSPNLETAAALLSSLPTSGLSSLQMLLGNYLKYNNLPSDYNISEMIVNSLKWFTSTKLIQPDWTPSGVLVSPLFGISPDLVAKARSGIMSLSRLIAMTTDALASADHDKAEAMLTEVVRLLQADWVDIAGKTVFQRSTASKFANVQSPRKLQYLASFWNRLKEMYKSLGDLGLLRQQQRELKGPLDLLAFSPEAIFSQIIFSSSQSSVPAIGSTLKMEEIAARLNVDLLQTIATCSCAQMPPEAHDSPLEHFDELFSLALNDLLSPENTDPIGEQIRSIFKYNSRRQNIAPSSSITARLWMSCSDETGSGAQYQQARPPSYRLNFHTAKLVFDRDERLFVLVALLSDFAHLLASDAAEEKSQPDITAVKIQLRSLKSRITENFRPLLTYMSLTTIPLMASLNQNFPSSLDSILLLPSTVKATLLVSDISTWFVSTVLRSLLNTSEDASGVNAMSFFDILPDSIAVIPSVIEYRDYAIIYSVESFFSPSVTTTSDLDLSRVVQMVARISDPCLRLEVMRRHCLQFTLSGFDFLVLTCPIPKIPQLDSVDGAADSNSNNAAMFEVGIEATEDDTVMPLDQKESDSLAISSVKELVVWLHDWQRRIDLWMRLASLMRLDITTTTVEHIHNLITNQSDFVADSLIAAGEFSTGLQLLNVCGASAFPVSLATRLMSAYLTSNIEETMTSPEQQARVVQQLDILATSDPTSCQQLLVSFLSSLVGSSASAASITLLPSRVFALLEFCKTQKIRQLLEINSKEDSQLVDRLDQMVKISRLIPDDLKESCGPLIHKPLLLLETLLMNVKVDLATGIVSEMLNSPLADEEMEAAIQNIVAVYAFKALELASSGAMESTSVSSLTSSASSANLVGMTQQRRQMTIPGTPSNVGSSPSITRPFLMPSNAPEPEKWMHDAKSDTCMACHRVRFSMFVRRHHCRRCGRIVCDDCSRKRATVRGETDARVCDDCYAQMMVIGEHNGSNAPPNSVAVNNTPGTSMARIESRAFLNQTLNSSIVSTNQSTQSAVCSMSVASGSVFQWQLSTDDEPGNSRMRLQFSYESAPNLALCLSVLSLCRNPTKAAQLMLQIVSYLSKYLKPTREIDAALVLSIMKQLLMRAKVKFSESASDSALSGLATMCDSYSKAIDFLDSLLQDNCQPIPTVSELIGRESSQRILTQLLSAERYAAAVRFTALMRPDLAQYAWLRWGLALLRVGCFESARQKFVKCLPKVADRRSNRSLAKPVQEILNTLESIAKRHPNVVADLVSDSNDRTGSMTIRDLLAEPPQIAGKGAFLTDPLPKPIFDEAVFYLTTYGNDGAVISFFQRHGYWSQAARYILESDCLPEVFVTCLLLPAASAGRLLNLEDQMLVCDATLVRWEKYLSAAFQQLARSNSYNLLHRLYVFAKDYVRAAYVCLKHFFPRGARTWTDLAQNVDFLHQARGHLEAYIDRNGSHWGAVEPPTPKRPTWEDAPLIRQFIPPAEVQRLSNAISLQFEVLEIMKARVRGMPNGSFATGDGNGSVKTLFTDVDSDKMAVVTELLMSASLVDSFTIARRIVTDFRLDPRVTYGNLGHELARSGNFDRLRQLLICLRDVLPTSQGETTAELIDDIICAAVRGIADRPEFSREQDALIAMLTDDDNKIEACLLCAKLRSAYLIAIHNNRERDVRRISEAATRLNQPLVKQICDQWLEQFSKEKTFGA